MSSRDNSIPIRPTAFTHLEATSYTRPAAVRGLPSGYIYAEGFATASACARAVSVGRFAVWPGASLLVPFDGGRAFIGVDSKFFIVEGANAFNAYGTVGVAF